MSDEDAGKPTKLQTAAMRSAAQRMVEASRKGPHEVPIRENTCGCGALRNVPRVGPLIRLRGYDDAKGTWRATVLYGTLNSTRAATASASGSAAAAPSPADSLQPVSDSGGHSDPWATRDLPLLHYRLGAATGTVGGCGTTPPASIRPKLLATFGSQLFWRFDLTVPVQQTVAQWLEYCVVAGGGGVGGSGVEGWGEEREERFRVYVPSAEEGWRWAFYSCAGFSLDVTAEEQANRFCGGFPLWRDLLSRHAAAPFSALVGGGDQLYNDDVWQVPALKEWLALPDPTLRLSTAFSPAMASQATAYFVAHYGTHMTAEPARTALASIPQVNTWDDHDIFDGWGSYPTELQTCPVFAGVFECARAAYLLFQHHTTPGRAASDGLLLSPQGGLHQLVVLGPRQALMLPDQRAERTRYQILPLESYADIFAALVRLPSTVRHITLVATVPLVYPHIIGSHSLLSCCRSFYRSSFMRPLMAKTGVSAAIMNEFGEPELLDDLRDHWTAPGHLGERRFLLEHMQMFAKSRSCRISIISGDVHLCGSGVLHTWPRRPWLPPRRDWRYMRQTISSAIVNAPPPSGLVRLLQLCGRAGMTNRRTRNHLSHTFMRDHKARTQLLNLRNWCEVEEEVQSGNLTFTLRVETPLRHTRTLHKQQGQPPPQQGGLLRRMVGLCVPHAGKVYRQPEQAGQQQHESRRMGDREMGTGMHGGTAAAVAAGGETSIRDLAPAGAAGIGGVGDGSGVTTDDGSGGRNNGGGGGRDNGYVVIKIYRVVVPPLDVPRPVPGSKEHMQLQGEDF